MEGGRIGAGPFSRKERSKHHVEPCTIALYRILYRKEWLQLSQMFSGHEDGRIYERKNRYLLQLPVSGRRYGHSGRCRTDPISFASRSHVHLYNADSSRVLQLFKGIRREAGLLCRAGFNLGLPPLSSAGADVLG